MTPPARLNTPSELLADEREAVAKAMYELLPNLELSGNPVSWDDLPTDGPTKVLKRKQANAAIAALSNIIEARLAAARADALEEAAKMVERPAAFREHIPIGCFLSFEKMAAAIRARAGARG
jgi:hypothetical protein